ncbi:MAG TPA: dipeptidase [Candidatus Acidoferrales bacterium]|jgi:membrane dipeptidase|nr:dipeptidase [Candidatus Acidoferrales bacterium]
MAEAELSVARDISERARDLHFRSLVIDTHVDTTQRLLADDFNLGASHPDGSIDIPRMREGGVGAVFFAVWIPGTVTGAEAVQRALGQIDAVRRAVARHAGDLVLARSAADILAARAADRIAVLLAVEGGHMLNHDLGVLRRYAELGVRYMTLTHVHNTDWADASTAAPAHNGLSDFGRDVIREMNRLGVAVDVSHASDKAVADALETSSAPIFASHSSCHALCATPRNLRDDLMRAIAAKGGLVQINFHTAFLSQKLRDVEKANPQMHAEIDAEAGRRCAGDRTRSLIEGSNVVREMVSQGRLPRVDWTEILEHIDHAVEVAGIDHVGLGSDFDGADMPYGMEDASQLPRITDALLDRGYSEEDIQRILGGNALRFLQNVEAFAKPPLRNQQ